MNGDKATIGAKEVSARVSDALGRLVTTVYHKLPYIDAAMGEANIRALFSTSKQQSLSLEGGGEANANALRDVLDFIAANSASHMKTSMKSLMDRFTKAPYGFVEDDVEWLVAKLFKNGDISFTVNGGSVTMLNKNAEEIIRYITKREFVDKLLTERREKASDSQKKSVRELTKELFGVSSVRDDDDDMMQSFQRYSGNVLNELEKYEIMQQSASLPGKRVVSSGKALLRAVMQIQSPIEFFDSLHRKRDDYLDFAEEYEPVKAFFGGEQKTIYERALKLIGIYDNSKTFIVDEQVENLVASIKAILSKDAPYADIPKLPELLDKFTDAYMAVLNTMEAPIRVTVDEAKARVMAELADKPYKDEMNSRCHKLFEEIYEKLKTCNNVAVLQNIKVEADALKVRLLNEIDAKDRQLAREIAEKNKQADDASSDATTPASPAPKVKKRRNISIKTINAASSWQIETPQDVDKYIAALRERLLRELDEDTVINIEF